MIEKPSICYDCPLHKYTGEAFVPPVDSPTADQLIVGEAPGEEEAESGIPFSGGAGTWLNNIIKAAKQERSNFAIINTILCRPPNNVYPTDPTNTYCSKQEAQAGVDYCREQFISPYINSRRWRRIIAVGGKSLQELTGRTGIEQWRGSPLPLTGETTPVVIPVVHPAALMRNAKLLSVTVGDFRKQPNPPPEYYKLYPSVEELKQFTSTAFAFDFEWDWTGNITLCGLSDKNFHAIVVPFSGEYITELRRIFENAENIVGHNIITADTKYTDRMGWDLSKARLWDTLLMQHLIQPDLRHGLAFVASVFTNKVFWKGADKEAEEEGAIGGPQYKTWNKDYSIPVSIGGYGGCSSEEEAFRLYNARDTDASMQIFNPLKTLLERYNLESTYKNVSVPIGYICRDLGGAGLAIDRSSLTTIREDLQKEINELDERLPDGLRSYTITKMGNKPNVRKEYKLKLRTCKGPKGNKHDPTTIEFPTPGTKQCPVCGKDVDSGKMIIPKTIKAPALKQIVPWNSTDMVLQYARDRGLKSQINLKTQRETADKNARKRWIKTAPEFIIVDQLKKAVTLRNSFAKPGLVCTDRMYFNLLPHGTAEGRLSSTGQRDGIDLNIQNIPESMKKIFVPDYEDWCFGDFDISQGENRLTAWFAKDFERLERLADPAYDEHSETATACFGITVTKTNENRHLRKAGKIVNHMLNYGAGWKKLQEVLASEGFVFTAQECKDLIWEWKQLNARTAKWQEETIALATAQGYLANPFGRRRWFQTRDLGPKALAFLPASTLADTVLRMMIAMHSTRFNRQLQKLNVVERMDFTHPWRMVTQVHDSIVVTGPQATAPQEFANIRRVMEQPWAELDGFRFSIEGKLCEKNLGEGKKIIW